jgi:hypothetical protein
MQHTPRTSVRSFVAVLVGLVSLSSSARASHPRTVFDAAELVRLRAARSTTHAEMASALVAALDRQLGTSLTPAQFGDPRLLGNVIAGNAMAARLVGDARHEALAKQHLMGALAWSDWGFGDGDDLNRAHLIIGAAVAYDVLFPVMSEAERTSVRARLGAEAQRFDTAVANRIWWTTDWLQNHNWINFGALGVAGFALEGEDARAPVWISRARANSTTLASVLDLVPDGSWHEGVGYQQYGWSMAMPYWMASARAGVDVAGHAMLRGHGAYRLWTQLPDLPRGYVATHGDWSGWAGPGSTQVLRYAAARFRDGAAQEAARRWIAGGPRSTRAEDTFYLALEYVAYDPSVAAADTGALAPDFVAADQGLAVLRTGWGPGAMVLGLKAGVLGGRANWERLRRRGAPGGSLNISHDHMDDLGLWIFGDGRWLLPECVGYNIGRTSGPKAWRTEFQNSLLVDGLGQLGDDKNDEDNGLAHAWFFERESRLEEVSATDGYAAARATGARLYPASLGVTSLERSVYLSREGWAVLRDDVALAAPRVVEQLLHALDAATVDGPWIRANSKDDRVLGIRVVAPARFATTISPQTADKLTKQYEPDGSVSLVKLRPASEAARTRFVELLWPTRGARWAARPDVQPLDAARPEAGFVVRLADGRESWAMGDGTMAPTGRVATSARWAAVREGADGRVWRLVIGGAGRLSLDGEVVLTGVSMGSLEVDIDGAVATLSGAEPQGASFVAPEVSSVMRYGAEVPWYREGARVVVGVRPPAPVDAGVAEGPDASVVPDLTEDAGVAEGPDASVIPDLTEDAGWSEDAGLSIADASSSEDAGPSLADAGSRDDAGITDSAPDGGGASLGVLVSGPVGGPLPVADRLLPGPEPKPTPTPEPIPPSPDATPSGCRCDAAGVTGWLMFLVAWRRWRDQPRTRSTNQ